MSDQSMTPQPRRRGNAVLQFLGRRWLPIVLIIALGIFVGQNRARVSVDFLFVHQKASLWLVILVAAVAGALVGALVARQRRRRKNDQPPDPATDWTT
jgi:uncharacterized integral membrane protein